MIDLTLYILCLKDAKCKTNILQCNLSMLIGYEHLISHSYSSIVGNITILIDLSSHGFCAADNTFSLKIAEE